MKLRIKHNQNMIADNILLADNFYSRVVGLMFKDRPPMEAEGLLLDPCNSIHTFFMKYPLDVVFMDTHHKVIKVLRNVKPWRMTWIYLGASKTLELPAGKLPAGVNKGDILEVENV